VSTSSTLSFVSAKSAVAVVRAPATNAAAEGAVTGSMKALQDMQIIRPTPTSAVRCIAVSLQYKLAKISSLQIQSSLTAAQAARICNEVLAALDDSRAL
jgi:hypothetical protein